MEKFIPYEKLSKKKKKEIDRLKRNDWGEINPATKVVPDNYKEKKRQRKNFLFRGLLKGVK